MNKKLSTRILLVIVIAVMITAFFKYDLSQYLTLEFLKSQHQSFLSHYEHNQGKTIAIYFAIYVAVTALSLPGAAVMTLAGGAIFGV